MEKPQVSDRPTEPMVYLALLVRQLEREGVTAASVLAGTGIVPRELSDRSLTLSLRTYLEVAARARDQSGDFGFALRLGLGPAVGHHGIYGYAILSSATLGEALEVATRYAGLGVGLLDLTLRVTGDFAVVSVQPTTKLGDMRPFVIDEFLGAWAAGTQAVGAAMELSELRLDFPAPAHRALYREAFGARVHFDCDAIELRYPASALERALDLSDPATAALCRKQCDALLARLGETGGLVAHVRRAVLQTPGKWPGLDAAAERLHTSARSLTRRLKEQGTSYQQILDDARKEVAIEYLQASELSVDQIAERVGYAETSNFRRAFKKWTGKSPRSYR